MEAAKAQNWAVEPQVKKIIYYLIMLYVLATEAIFRQTFFIYIHLHNYHIIPMFYKFIHPNPPHYLSCLPNGNYIFN
jgi:hypothetical protein